MPEEATNEEIDAKWYLNEYPDVEMLGMSAQEHYEWIGKKLGRKPNPNAVPEANDEPNARSSLTDTEVVSPDVV